MHSQRGQTLRGGQAQQTETEREVIEESTDGDLSEENPGNQSTTVLSKSEAFDVLRNSRRRAAITCLREHDGAMSVNELATCVATQEYDVSREALSSEQYKRVYTGLYQCHLDRADELGVVDFDADDNIVRLREEATQLDPFLGDDETPGSAVVELGVALTVALVVSLSGVGVGPFGAIPASLLAGLTIVALLGLALFQLY